MSLFSEDALIGTGTGCTACGLYKKCKSPRMKPSGLGKYPMLVVAEAPEKTEDEGGRPLTGESGQLLRECFARHGYDLDDCRMINAVNCRPPKNREPLPREIECCRNAVWNEIKNPRVRKPNVVLLVGRTAIISVIGKRWEKGIGTMARWRGLPIPDAYAGAWLFPIYHPSYLLRNTHDMGLQIIFDLDLEKAFSLMDTPLPDGVGVVPSTRILWDDARLQFLQSLLDKPPEFLCLDFEATGIKPYDPKHKIVTVAFCYDGNVGVAMQMDKKICPLLREVLRDKRTKKIAANMKFEDTWSRVKLKTAVRGWFWDTMLGSHCEDNRSSYNSLDFQTYLQFGIPDYSSEVAPYLKHSVDGFNCILECPELKLLEYNGIDTVMEFRLAMKQMKDSYEPN